MLFGLASMGGLFVILDGINLPTATRPLDASSFICLADVPDGGCGPDNAVARLSAGENRIVLKYSEIPAQLVDAVLASEDRTFFEHNGIDPTGIARALVQDVISGSDSTQGGSTITQQYVKNVYLSKERTVTRKLKEAALAVKLERKFTKTEILERYLNEVYFGRGAYGVEAAARAYFGTGVSKLRLDQFAYLAGLIRAPELADATKNPEEATRRRATVLDAMVQMGNISKEVADAAGKIPWDGDVIPRPLENSGVFVTASFSSMGGDYIVDWVRKKLLADYGEQAVFGGGLRVYLNIDPLLQRTAYDSITTKLNLPTDPAASLVSLDEKGRVVALVGGTNWADSTTNLALGKDGGGTGRSPGSTFKPVALAAFLDKGYSLDSLFLAPPTLDVKGLEKPVRNYNDEQFGIIDVRTATWHSVNTAYVQIAEKAGFKKIPEMAKRLGINSPVKPDALAVIGAAGEVSPIEMATAYSTLANHGNLIQPWVIHRVSPASGDPLFVAPEPVATPAIPATVADTVTDTLKGVLSEGGTGTAAKLKVDASGKTGTTDNYADAWFVGYTCHMTTAVWIGYPAGNVPMDNVHGIKVTGGTFPAQIWHDYMTFATASQAPCPPVVPTPGTQVLNPELATTTTTTPPATTPTTPETTPGTPAPTPVVPPPTTPPAAPPG